jgi:hypothetical protein
MSSSKQLALIAGLFLAGQLILSSQSAPSPMPLTCPASITVIETASLASPWQAEGAKSEHKFERPSIYNGSPGKQEYELAPDDTEQQAVSKRVREIWKLADYRQMNLFLRCRYSGTAATVVTNIPGPLKTCVFSFQNGSARPASPPAFECK